MSQAQKNHYNFRREFNYGEKIKHLLLILITKKLTTSLLSFPKDDLSKATVEAVARKIVDTKVLNNDKHTLTGFKKATYTTREVSELQYRREGGAVQAAPFFMDILNFINTVGFPIL